MKKVTVDIDDYLNAGRGIWLYNDLIYEYQYKDYFDHPYTFNFKAQILGYTTLSYRKYLDNTFNSRIEDISYLHGRKHNYEFLQTNLSIIDTFNLQDWLIEEKIDDGDDSRVDIVFDKNRFMKERHKDLYDNICKRYERYFNSKNVEPVLNTNSYLPGLEFLEFTDESAYHWSGPFIQNDKQGCIVKIVHYDDPQYHDYSYCDFRKNWMNSYFHDNEIDKKLTLIYGKNYANDCYGNDGLQIKEFNDLTNIQKNKIARHCVHFDKLYIFELKDYKVYLAGNDDCSYSFYCDTKEEAEQELIYLRKMQPLDFTYDILDRGYVFTN